MSDCHFTASTNQGKAAAFSEKCHTFQYTENRLSETLILKKIDLEATIKLFYHCSVKLIGTTKNDRCAFSVQTGTAFIGALNIPTEEIQRTLLFSPE